MRKTCAILGTFARHTCLSTRRGTGCHEIDAALAAFGSVISGQVPAGVCRSGAGLHR